MNTQLTPENIVSKAFNGHKNFMTPIVLNTDYIYRSPNDDIKTIVYELSKGDGIWNRWIYGVTIILYDHKTCECKSEHEKSKKFDTLAEANEYISELKKENK